MTSNVKFAVTNAYDWIWEYLGEISLIDKGRTTATATTEGPARRFVLSHREFNSLLDRSPAIRLGS